MSDMSCRAPSVLVLKSEAPGALNSVHESKVLSFECNQIPDKILIGLSRPCLCETGDGRRVWHGGSLYEIEPVPGNYWPLAQLWPRWPADGGMPGM